MEVDQIDKLQIVPPGQNIYYSYRNGYFCTMQSTTCTGTEIKPVIFILIGSNFEFRKYIVTSTLYYILVTHGLPRTLVLVWE